LENKRGQGHMVTSGNNPISIEADGAWPYSYLGSWCNCGTHDIDSTTGRGQRHSV